MKKNILFGLILFVVPALILAQPAGKGKAEAGCQQMKGPEMQCMGECKTQMPDLLKLTDQQKADHKKINLKYQRLSIQLRADLKLAHLDLQEALENLDQKKIDESVKKINDIKAKLYKNRIDQKVEFLKLLTEDQRKILKDQPCGMRKVKKIHRMEGPGGMGLMKPETGFSYGFDVDMPDVEIDPAMDLED